MKFDVVDVDVVSGWQRICEMKMETQKNKQTMFIQEDTWKYRE